MDVLIHCQHFTANAISTKNHVTILATDYEKAFDRIGLHVVINELEKWQVGKKMYNFIKAFLLNRQFRVRVNVSFSKFYPLRNGIPQFSPLSVILFIIAFDD